jgi:hypothetical protein
MSDFTPEDRIAARNLVKSPDTLAFLERLFCPEVETMEVELGKNVAALDDAEYGRLMKSVYLTKASFKLKMQQLKKLGAGGDTPPPRQAPR